MTKPNLIFLSIIVLLSMCKFSDSYVFKKIRVAVIGGGAGGIISIRQVINALPQAEVVCFEIKNDVGGTWIYSEKESDDVYENMVSSALYKSLRTNLPKPIMEFSDFPMPNDYKSFIPNQKYLQYLQKYADNYNIKKYIKFRHMVVSVKPKDEKWNITYKNLNSGNDTTEEFDYVFVCNGHFTKDVKPIYKGQDVFKGEQIHSRYYRIPEPYVNKTVLIIGAGPSGLDISIELAKYAKKVIVSHHGPPINSPFPKNYVQKTTVANLEKDSVVFNDGTKEEIDTILYCTGYAYDYPFLDSSSGLSFGRITVRPLYQHIVNIEHPSMFFMGIPHLCCAIPMMEMQAKYAVGIIKGSFNLPSKEMMLKHMEDDYERKDKSMFVIPDVALHFLGDEEVYYYEDLSKESGLKSVPPVFSAIRSSTMETRENLYIYREYDYHVVDKDSFVRKYSGELGMEDAMKDMGKCKLVKYIKTFVLLMKDKSTVKKSHPSTKLTCEKDKIL